MALAAGLYERAIEEDGDTSAMFNLSIIIRFGAQGVARNIPRALALLEQACISFGVERKPVYLLPYASVLLSTDNGQFRNPSRTMFALGGDIQLCLTRANLTELTTLHSRGY